MLTQLQLFGASPDLNKLGNIFVRAGRSPCAGKEHISLNRWALATCWRMKSRLCWPHRGTYRNLQQPRRVGTMILPLLDIIHVQCALILSCLASWSPRGNSTKCYGYRVRLYMYPNGAVELCHVFDHCPPAVNAYEQMEFGGYFAAFI